MASVNRQFTQVEQIAQNKNVQKLHARRPFGKPGEQFHYVEWNVLPNTEDKTFEYKALTQERPQKLPWKIMDKARTFICGILNGGGQGIIYFGIGDSYDPSINYKRGQIIGLDIDHLREEISKAFQSTLDDHIKSDYGKMTKGGDMNCVNIHFVPIWESEEPTSRYVVEIEVKREWMFCQDHVYYFKKWTEKRPKERGANIEKCGLQDLYKIDRNNWEDAVIRTRASSDSVKAIDAAKQVKEPLSLKYKEWQEQSYRGTIGRLQSQKRRIGRDPTSCYSMKRTCGFALIINIKSFEGTTKYGCTLRERHGSEVDVEKLEKLWKQFGFTVETHVDLKAHRICGEVQDMASKITDIQSCFVCCIMTHGDMNVIYGSDSKPVEIKYIIDLFKEDGCSALAGKPKLFFIQACRGSQGRLPATPASTRTPTLDANALSEADGDVDDDHVNDESFRRSADPSEPDFLIGYSTVADHVSFRDIERGTFYVDALVEIFNKYHTDEGILSMIIKINDKVANSYKDMGYKMCPAPILTLTKDICFS